MGIERRFDRFGDWLDGSWALRKANPLLEKYPKALAALTWLMRIAVGSVFIVSGLSKGIDPWGTYYKTTEYLTAMHLPIVEWGNTVLALSFMLFSVEFIIGVSLMLGCYRKAAPIMAALFMLVMLPLTLWIAVADPVADCGCFGDFLVIQLGHLHKELRDIDRCGMAAEVQFQDPVPDSSIRAVGGYGRNGCLHCCGRLYRLPSAAYR